MIKGSEITLRESLEHIERSTGKTPPELEGLPELPEAGQHVLQWFNELSQTRSVGMALNPISYQEIAAWSQLTGTDPLPWEVAAIRALDSAFINTVNEDQRKEANK